MPPTDPASRSPPARARQLLDAGIVLALVVGLALYLPRLRHAVHLLAASEEITDAGADPAIYQQALYLLGLLPLAGAIGIMVPCHSFFHPPLPAWRRASLGLLALAPVGLAAAGLALCPRQFAAAFVRLGLLSSFGPCLVALPAALHNVHFSDFFLRLLLPGAHERRARQLIRNRFSGGTGTRPLEPV